LIFAIVRTAIAALRRDRPSLALSFVLPIAFFSIFASVFGGQHNSTPKVNLIVVDEDQSAASRQLVQALQREGSLVVKTQSESKDKPAETYTAATAEAAVKAGDVPVALIVPHGFGEHPISFGPAQSGSAIQLLNDSSDMIAPQVVGGLLQKAAMTAMPSTMAEQGAQYTGKYIGGFTPEQQKRMDENMAQLRKYADAPATSDARTADSGMGGIIAVNSRAVVGQDKRNPMVSFYAAAIGVMFLLFRQRLRGRSARRGGIGHARSRAQLACNHDHTAGRQTGLQYDAGIYATGCDVSLGLGCLSSRLFRAHSRLCGDGALHGFCRGCVWHAAGQHVSYARATGGRFDVADSHDVGGGRQHVSALSNAAGDANGRAVHDQRLGD
jgi:hypothetical protein